MSQENEQSLCKQGGEALSASPYFSWVQIILIFLAFLVIGLACQWGGLNARTVYDGAYFVSAKQSLLASHDIMRILGMIPVRPLFVFTFYLNYLVAGLDPFYLRVLNVGFLAGAGLALAFLIMAVFRIPGLNLPGSHRVKQSVGVLVGLLFVIHPLQSFVVLYVWQREAIMACLFVFWGLAVYVATRSGRFANPVVGYVITAAIFLAGMLSKENVATLPALMVLAELTVFRQPIRPLLKRAGTIGLVLLPSVVLYLGITRILYGMHSEVEHGVFERLTLYYATGGLSIAEVVMTQCRIFFSYLSMMLFPFMGDVEFMRAEIISRSLLDPPETLLAVAGVVALAAAGFALIRRSPVVAFGILFMGSSLLPESMLIPQYLFFGYRAILPMGGLLLIAARGILPVAQWVVEKRVTARSIRYAAAVGVLIALAGLGWVTAERAGRWTHISFWQDLVNRLPRYSRDVQTIPYLDIAVNTMSVLAAEEQYAETMDVFQRVLVVTPGSVRTRSKSLDLESSVERFLKTFGDTKDRAGGALICLGVALQVTGKTDQAVAVYQKAVELDPNHSDVHLVLGGAFEAAGKLDEAITYYGKATETDPGSANAYLCLGNALKKAGKIVEAMHEYARSIQVDPKPVLGHLYLAIALHDAGYYPEAVEEYRKALQVDDNIAEVHHRLGRALAEQGEFSDAVVHYRRAIGLQPGMALAHADLGLLLEVTGHVSEALHDYRKAASADPENAMIQIVFGRALLAAGHMSEATQALSRAVELDPGQATAHHLLGICLEKSGNLRQAVSHVERVVELDPGSADAHSYLGYLLARSGEFERSIRELTTGMSIAPDQPSAYLHLGWVLELTGAASLGEEHYRAAIRLKPDYAEAHYRLAHSLLARGNAREAAESYRAVVRLKPDSIEAYADLAIALLHKGEIAEAVVILGRALSLNKENTQLWYAIGVAYAAMEQNDEAVKYLRRALTMKPDHAAAAAYLRELDNGRGPRIGPRP
ncbi:MAG: tetratricopeptide repeat protein [Thermodesulfobacteriota bacterium]